LNGLASASELADVIERYVTARYGATVIEPPESAEIDALCLRNASTDWLYPAKGLASKYTAVKKKRYPFGSVELMLDMEGDRIRQVAIHGDFFGVRPISELETLLAGKQLSETEQAINEINASDFILGMTNRELAELILE
jgi:lipoate-protein ligase A